MGILGNLTGSELSDKYLSEEQKRKNEGLLEMLKNMPEETWDRMHWLDKAALMSSPIPVIGTGVGLAADIRSAVQEPEEFFTPANLAMTGAGYVPFGRLGKYGEQLGIFAGTKAKGADLPALDRAKEMQAAGASREQIWRDTGWFESADGNWKWEIDDSQATLANPQELYTSGKVKDVINHPALEGQYRSDVMNTPIEVLPSRRGSVTPEGSYSYILADTPDANGITKVGERITSQPVGKYPSQRIPSILHELQHNVQSREGFAAGGTPYEFIDDAIEIKKRSQDIVDFANQRMKKSLDGKAALSKSDPNYQAKWDAYDAEYQKAMSDKLQVGAVFQRSEQDIAYQMYRDLAGEEEARAAANRFKLTAEQRRERFPEMDMDTPMEKQEVKIQSPDNMASVDYRGWHTAPTREGSNSIDDLADIYPDDIYSNKGVQYYGTGDRTMDTKTIDTIKRMQGNPDAEITIYRAVPKGVKGINSGDWVTINKDYAKMHGDSWVEDGSYDIISQKVKAKDIVTNGDSIHEWGYDPVKAK